MTGTPDTALVAVPVDADGWRRENRLLQQRCNDLAHRNERLRAENSKLREQLAQARRKRLW